MLPMFENSTGGGHRNAVGARINTEFIEKFRIELELRVGEK